MGHNISMLSIAAAGLYLVVLAGCALAATTAAGKRQPRWHLIGWSVLCALFVALIASRLTGLEAELSAGLRQAMRSSGEYEGRRTVQGLIVAAAAVVFTAIAFGALYHSSRRMRGRRNYALLLALAGGWSMAMLVTLRIVSLHMIDKALYGPLKLNWFADLGGALLILGAAVVYIRLVRARP